MTAETPITYVTAGRDARRGALGPGSGERGAACQGLHLAGHAYAADAQRSRRDPHSPQRGHAGPAAHTHQIRLVGTKPWDIQRTTAALLTESPRCYVLSSMGTGKTRAVIYAAD